MQPGPTLFMDGNGNLRGTQSLQEDDSIETVLFSPDDSEAHQERLVDFEMIRKICKQGTVFGADEGKTLLGCAKNYVSLFLGRGMGY